MAQGWRLAVGWLEAQAGGWSKLVDGRGLAGDASWRAARNGARVRHYI